MNKLLGIFGVFTALLTGSSLSAGAESAGCPKKVAFIEGEVLVVSATNLMKKIYSRLGCRDTQFLDLPGRRGIHLFNQGKVDGEVLRLTQAEAQYKRKFVRSEKPIFGLRSSLWRNPGQGKIRDLPTGYLLGVVWMEKYMKGRNGKAFHRPEDMFDAYNAGQLSGFLAADFSIGIRMDANELMPPPLHGETLHDLPLFHYLGEEFAPFMKRFSKVLVAEDPFKALSSKK